MATNFQALPQKSSRLLKEQAAQFPLARTNFIAMAVCAGLIILGFLLMLGGSSTSEQFNPDIFSTRRIVVGPGIAFIGFVAMAFAIIWRPKQSILPEKESFDTTSPNPQTAKK